MFRRASSDTCFYLTGSCIALAAGLLRMEACSAYKPPEDRGLGEG
jgi:hypothetical protein